MKKNRLKLKFKEKIKVILANKRIKNNTLVGILIVIFAAIVLFFNVVLNILVSRYDIKIDLTSSGLYKISNETREFLENYDKDVNLIVLNDEESFKNSDDVYANHIYNIAKNFASCSDRINLEFVNLNERPTFVSKYPSLPLQQNGILLTCDDDKNARFLSISDMFQRQFEGQPGASELQVVSSVEKNIAHTLEFLGGQNRVKTLVLTGHDEVDLNKAKGKVFYENGYEFLEFNILTTKIPDDCDLILIAAPMIDYGEEEIKRLQEFINKGKSIIYFASAAQPKLQNIEKFLSESLGVSLKDGVVVETDANKMSLSGPNDIFAFIEDENKYVENVSNKKLPINLNDCRPMEILDKKNDLEITPICQTSSSSTIVSKESGGFDVESSPKMPSLLAVGVNKKIDSQKVSKMAVFSSVNLLAGLDVPQLGNGELILNVLGEVAGQKSKTNVLPKVIGFSKLSLTKMQASILGVIFILFIPLVIVAIGFFVYYKRKRR